MLTKQKFFEYFYRLILALLFISIGGFVTKFSSLTINYLDDRYRQIYQVYNSSFPDYILDYVNE